MSTLQVVGPVGHHKKDTRGADSASEILQQFERGDIGGVKILEHQQAAMILSGNGDQLGNGVEESQLVLHRVAAPPQARTLRAPRKQRFEVRPNGAETWIVGAG